MTIRLFLPTDWAEYFSGEVDAFHESDVYGNDFAGHYLDWVRRHPHLSFDRHSTTVYTVSADEHGFSWWDEDLVCYEYQFQEVPTSSRHPMRRELRISVPAPTKLPLP